MLIPQGDLGRVRLCSGVRTQSYRGTPPPPRSSVSLLLRLSAPLLGGLGLTDESMQPLVCLGNFRQTSLNLLSPPFPVRHFLAESFPLLAEPGQLHQGSLRCLHFGPVHLALHRANVP